MPSRSALRRTSLACFPLVLLLSSCGGDGGGTDPDPITLSLGPSTASLFVGETLQLSATASGVPAGNLSYTTSAPGVATVDGFGLVTATGLGVATITATLPGAGVSATALVTVNPASIVVTPATAQVGLGETVQLTAQVTGGVGLTVTWTSADPAVATVDQTGLVTGEAAGTVLVSVKVDGQPVDAAAQITVTAPPAVTAARILDDQGQAADLDDIGDLLVFEFDVEGEVGEGGRIDILVDGRVLASQDFVIQAAPGVPPGLAAIRSSNVVRIDAATPVVTFDGSTIQEIAPRGARDISAVLNSTPGVSTIPLNGQSSVTGTFNPTPRLFIRGTSVPQGNPLIVVDGVPITNGDVTLDGQVAFDPGNIASVEVLRGVSATVLYGSAAQNGVVSITLKGSDADGTEGPTQITSVTGRDAGGGIVPMLLGTQDLVRGEPLPAIPAVDRKGGDYAGAFDAAPGFVVGSQTDLPASLTARADWSIANWTDFSGIASQGFDVAPDDDPTNWSYADVTVGGQLTGLDGRAFRLSDRTVDLLGNVTRNVLLDRTTDQPLVGFGDLTGPVGFAASSGIQNGTLGVVPGTPFQFDVIDADGADGPFKAPLDPSSGMGRIEFLTSSGSTFLLGDADGLAAAPDAFGAGFVVDFPALGPGVAFTDWSLADDAGNGWSLALTASYDPEPPVTTGLDASVTFNPFGDFTIRARVTDNLHLPYVGTGFRYPGLDGGGRDLTLIPHVEMLAAPHVRQFVAAHDYSAMVPGVAHHIELTDMVFPHRPNGMKVALGSVRVGGLDVGGNYGDESFDLGSVVPAAGPSVLTTGTDNVEATASPAWLCNRNLVVDCGPILEVDRFEALSYTSDTFPFTEAQLWGRKGLPNGEAVAIPLSPRITGVQSDFVGYSQIVWSVDVDATVLGLGPELTDSFWLIFTLNGEAVKTGYKPLGIVYSF